MAKLKKSAEELVQRVEDQVWDYLVNVRAKHKALMNPLEATSASNLILTQEAVETIDGLWGSDGGEK